MRAVVVYESMYGNTHLIAEAIGRGLETSGNADVKVVSVHEADAALAGGADLLVVGGPTHMHGMTRESSRAAAFEAAAKPDAELTLDPDAQGTGVREWLESVGDLHVPAAAFDTRIDAPALLTGRASKGIEHGLRERGCSMLAEPESFLVTKETKLEPDEEAHARRWGATLAAQFADAVHDASQQ